jgi:hypothetical protein
MEGKYLASFFEKRFGKRDFGRIVIRGFSEHGEEF